MAINADFTLGSLEDGVLAVGMVPPTPIGGWSLQFTLWRHQQAVSGSVSGLITKTAASGYGGGVSGITITNSGNGNFTVNLWRSDVSGGLEPGAYAYRVERLDSGNASLVANGYRLVKN